jgi:polyisoprenoid-binding protein YceI
MFVYKIDACLRNNTYKSSIFAEQNYLHMKKIFLGLAFSAGIMNLATAQNTVWNLDKSHSGVGFTIDHMVVSETQGLFKEFTTDVKSDKPDFTDAKVTLTIPVSSINTGDEKRDGHLKSADFFDVEKNSNIVFVSTSFKKIKGKLYELKGNLTMNGITKPVTLKANYNGTVKSPWGDTRAGIKVYGELDRYLWNLTYNSKLEAGGMILGQKVRIACYLELIKG